MQSYPFRGNVRELKNIIKKAVVLSERQKIDPVVIKSLQMTEEKVEKIVPNKKRKLKTCRPYPFMISLETVLSSSIWAALSLCRAISIFWIMPRIFSF